MKKLYLPLSVYNVWIAAALFQVFMNVYHAITTLPRYRFTHVLAIAVHLGLAGYFAGQRRKSRLGEASQLSLEGNFSERGARALLLACILFAALFEAFAIFTTVDYLKINARYGMPLTFGGALSQLGVHVMFGSMGYMMIAVSYRALLDNREAIRQTAENALSAEEVAPVSTQTTGWWTKDETRQEIRRR